MRDAFPENTLPITVPGAEVIRQENMRSDCQARKLRTLFLSDIHLGTRGCQADLLLDFLRHHHAETIYLVGDIIDGWRLKKKNYWPASHQAVFDVLLERGRTGTKIIYLPGNHDEFLRQSQKSRFGCIEFTDDTQYVTAAGRRYLVIHGDQYDVVIQNAKWLAYLGDRFYVTALALNTWLNIARRALGLNYWSLGAFAKRHVKQFVSVIGQFETAVASDIKRRQLHGVICGHIHHAANREMNGIHYLNTGDWVESCTAICERYDGTLEIIRWNEAGKCGAATDLGKERVVAA
jgi:UDP-2,3-diacylglucosamine pyrophosphatase LpxH